MPLLRFGTVKITEVSDQDWIVAGVVLKTTWPVDVPKPLPAMVTFIPACPTVGPIDPTSGAAGVPTNCQTATVCAGSVKLLAGLLPPDPEVTVRPDPPSNPPR